MRLIVLMFLFYSCQIAGFAQDSTRQENIKKDTLMYDFILFGAKYNSQFTFLGRDFGQDNPLVSANFMYFFHSGLWVNISSFHFFNENTPMQSAVSAGYMRALNERLELNLSYSQFIAAGESQNIGIRNQGMVQASLGVDWGLLYSTIQPQLLLNEQPDVLVATQHSRYFEFNRKLWKSIIVSFEPQLSMMLGTGHYYYLGVEGNVGGDEPSRFKWQNGELSLPVEFEAGSFSLKVFSKYVHPFNVPDWDPSTPRMVHGLELGYYVPVKRRKTIER